MNEHTPGPWRVLDADTDWVGVQMGRDGGFSISGHNSDANARLVAAAPDLLEALKAIIDALQREAPGTPLNNHRFDALGIAAHNAIAKAEGR